MFGTLLKAELRRTLRSYFVLAMFGAILLACAAFLAVLSYLDSSYEDPHLAELERVSAVVHATYSMQSRLNQINDAEAGSPEKRRELDLLRVYQLTELEIRPARLRSEHNRIPEMEAALDKFMAAREFLLSEALTIDDFGGMAADMQDIDNNILRLTYMLDNEILPLHSPYTITLPNALKNLFELLFPILLIPIALLICAYIFAGDYEGRGSILLLTQPISRRSIFFVKAVTSLITGLLLVCLSIVLCSIGAYTIGGAGRFDYPMLVADKSQPLLYETAPVSIMTFLEYFGTACLSLLSGTVFAVSVACLVGALTNTLIGALTGSLGVYLLGVMSAVVLPDTAMRYNPFTYFILSTLSTVGSGLFLLIPVSLLCLLVASLIYHRRDFH